MNSGNLTAIVAIVGLMITIAALFGSWKVSRNTQTTKLYRETAQAWEAKAKAQETEMQDMETRYSAQIHELQERDAEKDRELASLRTQLAVLQDLVTGKSALELLDQRTADILEVVKSTNDLVAQKKAI